MDRIFLQSCVFMKVGAEHYAIGRDVLDSELSEMSFAAH